MYRNIIDNLNKWKNCTNRMPLILQGARQVGKTWILEEFGKSFADGYIKIDFDKDKDLASIFQHTLDPSKIIEKIGTYKKRKITESTLIIFDEIQECQEALNSLKYFSEEGKQYYVVAAGSLLGVSLTKKGFPVGKVNLLNMFPMSFEEFLTACGNEKWTSYLNKIEKIESIEFLSQELIDQLKTYYLIGGMPKVVKTWIETKNIQDVYEQQNILLNSYENDFNKHTTKTESQRIRYIWDSMPIQLGKENKKFMYGVVHQGARAREYETSLTWLNSSGLINKILKVSNPILPLKSYIDVSSFKVYLNDVGLLSRQVNLDDKSLILNNKIFGTFKGSLTENFVCQSLIRQYAKNLFYWGNNNHEIDFMIQKGENIIPIEVKSALSVKSPSLKWYLSKYSQTKLAVRLSLRDLSLDGKILNVPLYLVDELDKLINIALSYLDN